MPITWLTDPDPGLDEPATEAYTEEEHYQLGQTPSARAVLRCAWDQRHGVLANILDNTKEWPYGDIGQKLRAIGGSIRPKPQVKTNDDGSGNAYISALIDLTFGWLQLDDQGPGGDGAAYYSETLSPIGEMIKLKSTEDDGPFFWDSDANDEPSLGALVVPEPPPDVNSENVNEEEAPSKLIIGYDYVMRWHRLSSVPAEVLTMIDHVNDRAVFSPTFGLTFNTDTLLLTAATITQEFSASTTSPVKKTLELHFGWRQNGWNRYWRPMYEQFEKMWFPNPDWDPDEYDAEIPATWPYVAYYNYPRGDFSAMLPSAA